jgi:hypothetical protein
MFGRKAREQVMVRLSRDFTRNVVFLGLERTGAADDAAIDPKGIGFLIRGEAIKGAETYLATAKHVVTKLGFPFVVCFNATNGGARLVRFASSEQIQWHDHPDQTVDLAVARINCPNWADNVQYELADIVQKEGPLREAAGAGDVVYIVGLFHRVYGTKKNMPVTHTGTIALIPGSERIATERGGR